LPALPSTKPDTDAPADLLVKVNGLPLAPAVAACLIEASVNQRIDGVANSLTLRVAAWDSDKHQLAWIDDQQFEPGREVEVEMGYLGARDSVFTGEIVGYELELTGSERPVMTIHAYDVLHRLGRGQRSRPPPQQDATYADIVREVAKDYDGLSVDASDARADPKNSSITQESKSDLQFLVELAHQIGFELFAVGKTLTFRATHEDQPPSFTLDADLHLVQLSGTLAANNQYGGVEVRGVDTETKQTIVATAQNDQGGSTDSVYGKATTLIIDAGITTQEQATVRANAELARMRAGFINATGTCFGRTDLQAGIVIKVVGLGTRFSGPYYVTSTTHTVSPAGGYRTSFSLKGSPR
jgi:phage protein D